MTEQEVGERIAELSRCIEGVAQAGRVNDRKLVETFANREEQLRKMLAATFGERHGWTVGKAFDVWRFKPYHYRLPNYGTYPPILDHPYFYWAGDKPVAVVAHIYDYYERNCKEVERFAADHGLTVQCCEDFPSWWYPGNSVLVVITKPG